MWSIWTHYTLLPGCLSNKQEDWKIPSSQMSSKIKLIFVLFRYTVFQTLLPELTVLCCHENLFEGWDIEVETQSSDAKQVFLRKFVVYGISSVMQFKGNWQINLQEDHVGSRLKKHGWVNSFWQLFISLSYPIHSTLLCVYHAEYPLDATGHLSME